MCDCPEDKEDGEKKVETVMLFKKCQKPYRTTKDIVKPSSYDTVSDKDLWTPADSSQSTFRYTCDSPKGSQFTSSFTSSSKIYKFVTSRGYEYLGEGEEEWRPPFDYQPCIEDEEMTEEERADIECTLMIIKPEALVYREEIERRVREEGFQIFQTRWLQLTPEQVSEFYSDKYGQLNFAYLVAYMASGPIVVHVLGKKNAIHEWKLLMGPTKVGEARLYYPDSIRARYGRRGDDFKNAVHGSDTRECAEKEIHFFFPDFIVEPLLKDEMAEDYLWEVLNPILVEALSMLSARQFHSSVDTCINWTLEEEYIDLLGFLDRCKLRLIRRY
ncbi:nucleoside diphosphate kinase homolog 5-like isoform X1 [Apis dorsata]|uniref:nucleoside diphosphate kinase homolog 5-like isoform X1 n=1 Tax=Apis dorsata TaxID=7462 RepID=UPI001293D4C1|nr:nucleoside diphosphate kinase homolog 5-like isoform X1 [Apis dorsata]